MASAASTSCAMVHERSATPSAFAGVVRRATWDTAEIIMRDIQRDRCDVVKPSVRMDGPIEELAANLPPPPADNDDPFLSITVGFQFNPLEIKQGGKWWSLPFGQVRDTS
jgi:hypothetical protein